MIKTLECDHGDIQVASTVTALLRDEQSRIFCNQFESRVFKDGFLDTHSMFCFGRLARIFGAQSLAEQCT